MFRPATRLIARPAAVRLIPRATAPARRFISTAPPSQKSRSWKNLAARIGIAGALIYYYNTTEVFAEEPGQVVKPLPETDDETETLPTIEALAQERQQRKAQLEAAQAKHAADATEVPVSAGTSDMAGGVEGLEQEADQQGAFNPETGEINWDCPCLGGMADGPCGEQFKAAFSCFVYSTEEPKGMDCIEKFKDMQNCFREYPEIYGAELDSDEDDDTQEASPANSEPLAGAAAADTSDAAPSQSVADIAKEHGLTKPSKPDPNGLVPESYRPDEASKDEKTKDEPVSESEALVPKAAHDATQEAADRK
ncbi:mitochondrial intermembrane space import and assembly protein-like protein 40 [Periconia macrospinosa]|uniref:Mitochondrial intermembrane space import and assembly protein 40 n=1 Tax=Periconia macrospinosa TaxID=97972 RepID=A0A2V1DNN7_9PLEO|nr:mitochondrial intermembrane space import and assembly protein-like protein 40 [Periconia macrospinosa]